MQLDTPRGEVHLGPPPGPRVRSGVTVPNSLDITPNARGTVGTVNYNDDDLEEEEKASFGRSFVRAQSKTRGNQEDSDSGLEIEP